MNSLGTSVSMGRVLLVCDDSAAIQQLAEGMKRFAIATEVCPTVSLAVGLVNRKKFEAIIIDSGMMQAPEMLGQVRLSPSNHTAVTFAITDPSKPERFQVQPNFLIEKPLSMSSVGGR
jgi:DNA-binding response OmpR family regulator